MSRTVQGRVRQSLSHRAPNERGTIKYVSLGYIEPGKFEGMTEYERHAVLDECFEHNDHLRTNGHIVAEIPLQRPETALTLYWKNDKVATTDGPYAAALRSSIALRAGSYKTQSPIPDKNEGKLPLSQLSLCHAEKWSCSD